MMAKPMKTLELHYPMIQFLIITNSAGEWGREGTIGRVSQGNVVSAHVAKSMLGETCCDTSNI